MAFSTVLTCKRATSKNMEESRKRIIRLQEELDGLANSWGNVREEWMNTRQPTRDVPIVPRSRQTYLSHTMADSFSSIGPVGSKCLFEVALREMTSGVDVSARRPSPPVKTTTSCTEVFEGDKYCVDLAGTEYSPDIIRGSVPEFSRFLMGLAGETTLAHAHDPARFTERYNSGPFTPNYMHDRLIR
jgi:hypothetical protein